VLFVSRTLTRHGHDVKNRPPYPRPAGFNKIAADFVGRVAGSARFWSAATGCRFETGRHVARFQSADMSAHAKTLARRSTTPGQMPTL